MSGRAWWRSGVLLVVGVAGFVGCQGLTRSEAAAALEEAELSSEAVALTSSSIEISTNFTIGEAVEDAAAELRSFVESQLPCAAITLEGNTLTTEYGANPGTCTYRGQTYGGVHQVSVMRNQMDDVIVEHTWMDFHNDRVSVSGHATVTWSFAEQSRHVVHELTWTRTSDGRMGTGSGDRVQRPLEEGLLSGFSVDGTRQWEGESGTWDLAIENVEMRWVDPVPQSGRYVLTTPENKMLTLSFARSATSTITVTIASGVRSYDIDVTTLPSEE